MDVDPQKHKNSQEWRKDMHSMNSKLKMDEWEYLVLEP